MSCTRRKCPDAPPSPNQCHPNLPYAPDAAGSPSVPKAPQSMRPHPPDDAPAGGCGPGHRDPILPKTGWCMFLQSPTSSIDQSLIGFWHSLNKALRRTVPREGVLGRLRTGPSRYALDQMLPYQGANLHLPADVAGSRDCRVSRHRILSLWAMETARKRLGRYSTGCGWQPTASR